ncbi:VOC family protein [Oceanobacillus manasiensis]|uniref:VOC family protein n=1 Tax=Oceanobacillus manasiensis TaxID=586413 RepID=UPI0005AB5316|nr:VOC family protein [Oceanobacillus manasiensis]
MESPIKNQMNTVFVHVSELPLSVEWYCRLLGQTYVAEKVSDPIYNMEINDYTGLLLDAGPPGEKQQVHPSKHPIFNFHTDNIEKAYSYVQEIGYQIESPIERYEDLAFFNIKDPDGNIIMICNG